MTGRPRIPTVVADRPKGDPAAMASRWDQRDTAVGYPEMPRRAFLATIGGGLLAAPLAAEAQPAGKEYRIGILGEKASDSSEARLWQGFREELGKRGWIEGRNILIESRWAEGNTARLPKLAADLVRLRMDVIVTRGSIFVQAAKTATSLIPVVFTMHADPIRTGHVASLASSD